jgi:CRISPR-associated protein Csx16
MKTYFVSRHPGAIDWAAAQGIEAELVTHFDPSIAMDGDVVIGSLPINLVAQVCAQGARYMHLSLVIPAEYRGKELTAELMDEFGAKLEWFDVMARPSHTIRPYQLDWRSAQELQVYFEQGRSDGQFLGRFIRKLNEYYKEVRAGKHKYV